ncbi:unnamed protein product [Tuber melanosporum]|uniref:(Perigord truffle) hypothetical protein n=1 Tax=Tuber melanosporum (strain Mel28) TaxID=656061 RepID=D5GIT7_TUBMM|nr:uncharacterized protein GSTUM_00008669001 [Tuber melanosporum]CAZ84430.1 unnamed protein product [Tuber melanosporum]
MSSISLKPLLRIPTPPNASKLLPRTATRNATLLRRPKRPHQFDQLIILTDGSSFKQMTTSPRGVFRTTKDTRNHPLWNESDAAVMGLEEDEAGKLKAFRNKYGHGFDMQDALEIEKELESDAVGKDAAAGSLMDVLRYNADEEDIKGGKKK